MTSLENQSKNSNRTYIILGAVFGLFALAAVTIIVSLLLGSDDSANQVTDENGNETPAIVGEVLTEAEVPEVSGFTAEVNPDNPSTVTVEFTIATPVEGLIAEYELLDVNRKSVLKDSSSDMFTVQQIVDLVDGVNSFTLRVRVTDGVTYSPWVTEEAVEVQATVDVPGVGVNAEPNPAYFNTDWANGVGGEASFEEALNVAWGATRFEQGVDACLVLNEAALRPGEMIPPVPNGVPENIALKFDYQTNEGETDVYFMAFLWCEVY